MGIPLPENRVFSEIVKEIFGDILQYETDVPEDFTRPCFLFINPDKTTRTEPLTKAAYKAVYRYEIYGFSEDGDVDGLRERKDKIVDYLMGCPKIPIPDTDRYFTIENVDSDTNDADFVSLIMVDVSEIKKRDLRRKSVPKIRRIVNQISVDGGVIESVESTEQGRQ